ncbi:hypothetical protein RRG08_033873 [Elysia crispata]|uniref:Uncharacterized protein n=1 Tax=Elysia crispata TaxID=231223 RepID=A0AAE1BAK8_9GAST|nr:hypothetical protein RRG08_033873 [Elysia crispata]
MQKGYSRYRVRLCIDSGGALEHCVYRFRAQHTLYMTAPVCNSHPNADHVQPTGCLTSSSKGFVQSALEPFVGAIVGAFHWPDARWQNDRVGAEGVWTWVIQQSRTTDCPYGRNVSKAVSRISLPSFPCPDFFAPVFLPKMGLQLTTSILA